MNLMALLLHWFEAEITSEANDAARWSANVCGKNRVNPVKSVKRQNRIKNKQLQQLQSLCAE